MLMAYQIDKVNGLILSNNSKCYIFNFCICRIMYLINHSCIIAPQIIEKMNDCKRDEIPQSIIPSAEIDKVCNEEIIVKQKIEDSNDVKIPTPFENIELSKLFNAEMRYREGKILTICYFKRFQDNGLQTIIFIRKYLTLCEIITKLLPNNLSKVVLSLFPN